MPSGNLKGVDVLALDQRDDDDTVLKNADEYSKYFLLLQFVIRVIRKYYQKQEAKGSTEAKDFDKLLDKLLYLIDIIRVKYTYDSEHTLRIDLSESGFPNLMEIKNIFTDMLNRQSMMLDLPSRTQLIEAIINHLITVKTEPTGLLQELSRLRYLLMLDRTNNIFFDFTPGTLELKATEGDKRSYVFSWGGYDWTTNRPYLHIMGFDQDRDAEPLEKNGPTWSAFLEKMKFEGSRAPDLAVLAGHIDNGLDWIHPQIIKRLGIGPLYAPMLMDNSPQSDDPRQEILKNLMARADCLPTDFVVFLTEELVFARGTQSSGGGFFPLLGRKKASQIFYIPSDDPECFERKASVVQHTVILPHRLRQNIGAKEAEAIEDYKKCRVVSYNSRGDVYA